MRSGVGMCAIAWRHVRPLDREVLRRIQQLVQRVVQYRAITSGIGCHVGNRLQRALLVLQRHTAVEPAIAAEPALAQQFAKVVSHARIGVVSQEKNDKQLRKQLALR